MDDRISEQLVSDSESQPTAYSGRPPQRQEIRDSSLEDALTELVQKNERVVQAALVLIRCTKWLLHILSLIGLFAS